MNSINPEYFLFFNKNRPIGTTSVRRKFNEFIKIAQLNKITLHGIRHSNCTWLLSDNLNPEEIDEVSERQGHSSIRTTLDIYMHIHKITNPKIIKKLDELL